MTISKYYYNATLMPSEITIGQKQTFTLTPTGTGAWNNNGLFQAKINNKWQVIGNFEQSAGDVQTFTYDPATMDLNGATEVVVSGNFVLDALPIGNDKLIGANVTPTEIANGQNFTLTVTPRQNMTFEGGTEPVFKGRWYNEKWYSDTLNFTKNKSNYTLTFTPSAKYTEAYVEGKAIPTIAGQIAIDVSELQNATVTPSMYKTALNETNVLTVKPSEGYIFNTPPIATVTYSAHGSERYNGTLKQDFSYEFNIQVEYDDTIDVAITGTATKITPSGNEITVDTAQMKNVSYTAQSSKVYKTDLYARNIYQIKANEKFTLIETPYLLITHSTGQGRESFIYDSANDVWNINVLNFYSGVTKAAIVANAIGSTELLNEYQLINAYTLTKEQVTELKKQRFYNYATEQYEDLGEYILSFTRYPFQVETTDSANVQLGFKQTTINAPCVNKQVHTLSLGSVTVNGLYKNESDVSQCAITANIQYIGSIEISSEYINTEIKIEIAVDVLSNIASVFIYSNNVLVDTRQSVIGYAIPYILETDKPRAYTDFTNNVKTLEGVNCEIIVRQQKNTSGTFSSNRRATLNEISGYAKISDVELQMISGASAREIDEIINELSNGVYF